MSVQAIGALTPADFCRAYKCGKSFFYNEVAAGRLTAVKAGRKTLVPVEAAEDWLKSCPALGVVR